MHVPDGFFDTTTSVAAGAATAVTLAVCLKKSADQLDERQAPLAGLVAAFIFALQMLNFPVANGTSGHLLGGTLAAVLVGPWTGTLCLAIVLLVQAVVFADGGLSAYGVNVLLIAVVPAFVGYGAFRLARALLPARLASVVSASGFAALVSVPAAAALFAVLYGFGGAVDLSFGSIVLTMVGVHVLVGIGEAMITACVVSAVVATRPDLVHGAAHLTACRQIPVAERDRRIGVTGNIR